MRKALLVASVALLALSATGTVTAGPTDGLVKMDPSMRVRLSGGILRDSPNVAMFVKTSDVAATRKEIERLGEMPPRIEHEHVDALARGLGGHLQLMASRVGHA